MLLDPLPRVLERESRLVGEAFSRRRQLEQLRPPVGRIRNPSHLASVDELVDVVAERRRGDSAQLLELRRRYRLVQPDEMQDRHPARLEPGTLELARGELRGELV